MKKSFVVIFLVMSISLAGTVKLQVPSPDADAASKEIKLILDKQKSAWNEGDLKGYMSFYWNSEELTFQSGVNRLKGWAEMLSRYEAHYPPEKRGLLDFTDVEVRLLCSEYAYALGRWKLVLADSPETGGLFTLIFQKTRDGWRIILDHTS